MPGNALITLAQDHFNPVTDLIEIDPLTHDCVGLWADYYNQPVEPTPDDPTPIVSTGIISVAGSKEIKVGGSYKKFTVNFYDANGIETTYQPGTWSFWIDGVEIADMTISMSGISANQIKAKMPNNGLYINKIMTVKFTVTETADVIEYDISTVSL